MAKVISFEKFMLLTAAGVDARKSTVAVHRVQLHSADEDFVQVMQLRAAQGRGY